MMIQHCRQSWEESETTIGYGPPPTTAPPLTHQGEGPAKQREITPLGLTTHTTRTTTAHQLKMESSPHDNIPAKERDLVKSEVDGGTDNNLHSQEPAQGRETGRANKREQYLADNPLDLTVGVPTQGAKRGANKKSHETRRPQAPLHRQWSALVTHEPIRKDCNPITRKLTHPTSKTKYRRVRTPSPSRRMW